MLTYLVIFCSADLFFTWSAISILYQKLEAKICRCLKYHWFPFSLLFVFHSHNGGAISVYRKCKGTFLLCCNCGRLLHFDCRQHGELMPIFRPRIHIWGQAGELCTWAMFSRGFSKVQTTIYVTISTWFALCVRFLRKSLIRWGIEWAVQVYRPCNCSTRCRKVPPVPVVSHYHQCWGDTMATPSPWGPEGAPQAVEQ